MPIEFWAGYILSGYLLFIYLATYTILACERLCLTSFGEPLPQFHERFGSVRDLVLLFTVIGIHIEEQSVRFLTFSSFSISAYVFP